MQRSLALVFSLIMVSATSAVTVYELMADETSVYLNVTGPPEEVYAIMAIESPGVFTAAYLGPQAPDESSWNLYDSTSATGAFVGGGYEDGVWAITDYSASIPVTVSLYTTPDFVQMDLWDSITVPEPTAIALLGLGMLLLRRHRK